MTAESAAKAPASCTIDEVRDSWDRVAPIWSAFVREDDVHRERLHGPALLKPCGDVAGLNVLDMGWGGGGGWCSRELAGRGPIVTAIDIAPAMIEEARRHPKQAEQPVDYHVMDAAHVDQREEWAAGFDLVTACMALHCMPDPASALRAVRRVLSPAARLVFSIPHPTTHARAGRGDVRGLADGLYVQADGYFDVAVYRRPWRIGDREWETRRWSRPHSAYVNMLKTAGFVIWHEPAPPPSE